MKAHPEAPRFLGAPTHPLQTASAASRPISTARPASAPPNTAVTSFLLQVTSQAPARFRPPACHRHLASNSSRPNPTFADPAGRQRSGKSRDRLQIVYGGTWVTGRPGAAFQFQEQSHLAQRRGRSLAALTWGPPAAHGLGRPAPGAGGSTCQLTSIRRPKIRNGEGKPFHSKALSSRIACHTVCRSRTT